VVGRRLLPKEEGRRCGAHWETGRWRRVGKPGGRGMSDVSREEKEASLSVVRQTNGTKQTLTWMGRNRLTDAQQKQRNDVDILHV
jgi:hypothetical protein